MTEQTQEPIIIKLSLNVNQVNFILDSLGKLPTESGAWMLRQLVLEQANQQIEVLHTQKEQSEKMVSAE